MDATEVGGGVEGFEVGFIAGSDDGINVSSDVGLDGNNVWNKVDFAIGTNDGYDVGFETALNVGSKSANESS